MKKVEHLAAEEPDICLQRDQNGATSRVNIGLKCSSWTQTLLQMNDNLMEVYVPGYYVTGSSNYFKSPLVASEQNGVWHITNCRFLDLVAGRQSDRSRLAENYKLSTPESERVSQNVNKTV